MYRRSDDPGWSTIAEDFLVSTGSTKRRFSGPLGASGRKETDVCVKTALTGLFGAVTLGAITVWVSNGERQSLPQRARKGMSSSRWAGSGNREQGWGPAGQDGCCSTLGCGWPWLGCLAPPVQDCLPSHVRKSCIKLPSTDIKKRKTARRLFLWYFKAPGLQRYPHCSDICFPWMQHWLQNTASAGRCLEKAKF